MMRPTPKSYRTANQPRRKVHQTTRPGVSLVELVLSMVVMTILLAGMSSAMVLASRAVPDLETPLKAMADGYHAADGLAGELFAAQTITFRSATVVEFTVDDRADADTNPEIIRYSWGGTAGQPLTRQYNNGTIGTVLENVYQFDLRYDTQIISGASKVTVVHITIRAGADATSRVDTSVQLPNQPS